MSKIHKDRQHQLALQIALLANANQCVFSDALQIAATLPEGASKKDEDLVKLVGVWFFSTKQKIALCTSEEELDTLDIVVFPDYSEAIDKLIALKKRQLREEASLPFPIPFEL